MNRITRLAGAAIAALVVLSPLALADKLHDSAASSSFDWTGFYAGLNGGYGFAGNRQLVITDTNSELFPGLAPSGGFVGAQVGYNVQGLINSNFVAGLEADIQAANISATGLTADYDFQSKLSSFGTARGRLGYAVGPTMFYVTGGLAFGGLEKITNTYGAYFADSKMDTMALGYVLGGGVEYAVNQNWSIKAEYQYMNFGKNDVCASPAYQCVGDSNPVKDDDYHMVRLGVNVHF